MGYQKYKKGHITKTLNKNNCLHALSYSQNFKHTMLSPQGCEYMGFKLTLTHRCVVAEPDTEILICFTPLPG